MRIAIPLWQNRVAPLMDCCSMLKIFELKKDRITEVGVLDMREKNMAERIKMVREMHPEILICNGISFFYRACLLINAIHVIPNVMGEEESVLNEIFGLPKNKFN